MKDFEVVVGEDERGRTVVSPRGELDLSNHQELSQAISDVLEGGQADIVVDLTDTTFLDSTSLGALISARRRSYAAGGSLLIRCPDPRLLRLFEVTKLDKVFTIERE